MRIILRKLPVLLATLLVVSFLTFGLTSILPGDPTTQILGPDASDDARQAVRDELHLDDPLPIRYGHWLGDAVTGDFGRSYRTNQPVAEAITDRLPVTAQIGGMAILIALLGAVPLGMLSAHRAGGRLDRGITGASFGLLAVPNFMMAIGLIFVFAVTLGLLPATGWVRFSDGPLDNLRHALLPALSLAVAELAVYTRLLRTDMIASLQDDYVTLARAKGVPTRRILWRHALRPSSFSLMTVVGVQVGAIIGGAVVVEQLFAVPGVGRLLFEAVVQRDLIMVQGVALVIAVSYVVVNFLVDVLYAYLDPRIHHGSIAARLTAPSPRAGGAPVPAEPAVEGAETLGVAGVAPVDVGPRRRRSLGVLFWLAVAWLTTVALCAVFATVLPVPNPIIPDVTSNLAPPGESGLLGTDGLGRDTFSRLVHGARVSLVISLSAVTIGIVVGGTLGMLVGYFRGWFETVAMAVVDIILAFPGLVLLLVLLAYVGRSLTVISLVVGFLSIPIYTRVARANTLAVAQREFVRTSRTMGAKDSRIIFKEILPNVILPVAAFGLVAMGVIIVLEGSLAFLGLSVEQPEPTWGGMIFDGKRYLDEAPHVAAIPSIAMFLTVLSLNFVGDTLRSRFDVKESKL